MKVLGLPIPVFSTSANLGGAVRLTLLGTLFLYAFHPVLVGLVQEWSTQSEYSHAFLVPVLSAYLLWRRRTKLQAAHAPSAVGLGLFVLGLLTASLGYLAGEEFIQRLAIPVTLMGLVFFLAGWPAAKPCVLPISFLFLMIPIPYPVYKAMALNLRLFDGTVAAAWASALGVPILREGYLLHLPRITLEVADGCSGTLSLLALVTLGTFYISEKDISLVRKVVLWIAIVPIAVLANIIRITAIAVLVNMSGDWILDTVFHKLVGTANFVLGFGMLMLLGSLLSPRLVRRRTSS